MKHKTPDIVLRCNREATFSELKMSDIAIKDTMWHWFGQVT
jgi:hypothetical protein